MSDRGEQPETDRADCLICHGTGSLGVILGDNEMEEHCWACVGTGLQLSRDELCQADVNEWQASEAGRAAYYGDLGV